MAVQSPVGRIWAWGVWDPRWRRVPIVFEMSLHSSFGIPSQPEAWREYGAMMTGWADKQPSRSKSATHERRARIPLCVAQDLVRCIATVTVFCSGMSMYQ